MKTLIVHDKDGNIVFTSAPANATYNLFTQDIGVGRILIGVDLETKKAITVSEDIKESQKIKMIADLKKKNELYNAKIENEELKKTNEELNGEIKKEIGILRQGMAEVGELLFDNTDALNN